MQANQVERFANEAIFVLQFNTPEAIRYVQRNAGVAESVARQRSEEHTSELQSH